MLIEILYDCEYPMNIHATPSPTADGQNLNLSTPSPPPSNITLFSVECLGVCVLIIEI